MQLTMKVNFLERQSLPLGLLAQDSLSGVTALVKEVFTKAYGNGAKKDKLSYWQLIFLQSKANGCSYSGERLPQMKWHWPSDTWFQEQLSRRLKVLESAAHQTRKRESLPSA